MYCCRIRTNREAGEGEAEDTNETHHEREIYTVNAMRVLRTIRISWAAPFAPQLLGHRPCPRGITAVATSIYDTPRP